MTDLGDGRIPRGQGQVVELDGKKGVFYSKAPEEEALDRWHNHDFLDVERAVDAARITVLRSQGLSWAKIGHQLGLGEGTIRRTAVTSPKTLSKRSPQLPSNQRPVEASTRPPKTTVFGALNCMDDESCAIGDLKLRFL